MMEPQNGFSIFQVSLDCNFPFVQQSVGFDTVDALQPLKP